MLSQCIIDEIERLLADGVSRREVARLVGVCRNTVNAIAADKRSVRPSSAETAFSAMPRRRPQRCATCGGMVFPPCRLCRLRDKKARRQAG